MEYTKKQMECAKKIFGERLKSYLLLPGIVQRYASENDIDMDFEMECFLDKYCVFVGYEAGMVKYFVEYIEDEINRRMEFFTCKTKEAKAFLLDCIEKCVLNNTITFYKSDSFEASIHDVMDKKCYSYVNGHNQRIYFVMDFSDADFTFDEFIDVYEDSLHGIIEAARDEYFRKKQK